MEAKAVTAVEIVDKADKPKSTPATMPAPMRSLCAFLVLLSLAGLAHAQIELPAEIRASPGMVIIEAKTESSAVGWYSPDGVQVVPSRLLADKKTAICFVTKVGRYRVIAWTGPEGYAETVIVIGNAPKPPGPPDPRPPEPPAPSSFEARLAAAYEADGRPAVTAQALAEFYRELTQPPNPDPNINSPGGPIWDPKYKTAGQLGARVLALANVKMPDRNKFKFYKVVSDELAAKLAILSSVEVTDALRQQIASEYDRVAEAIDRLR